MPTVSISNDFNGHGVAEEFLPPARSHENGLIADFSDWLGRRLGPLAVAVLQARLNGDDIATLVGDESLGSPTRNKLRTTLRRSSRRRRSMRTVMHRFALALKSYWIRTGRRQSECELPVQEQKRKQGCCRIGNSVFLAKKVWRSVGCVIVANSPRDLRESLFPFDGAQAIHLKAALLSVHLDSR